MIALGKQTYQLRDRDSQGFSRSLDCILKSRKQMKHYRTPKELAYEYDVSETTVIRWCRTGYLPSIKVGGRWRIDPDVDLESLSNPLNEQLREEMKAKGW